MTFVHPEAPKPGELDSIVDQVEEIWEEFFNRNTDFKKWEKSENLDGLISDMSVSFKILQLKGHESWHRLPEGQRVSLLATFLTGIRLGAALGRIRDGRDW